MAFGRVCADHHDAVCILHAVKRLRACRRSHRLIQAVSGRRVADACAGINIVVTESRTNELLNNEYFFVCATRRCYAADRFAAMLFLNALEATCCVGECFIPTHFTPGIVGFLSNHWIHDALFVRRVAPGEATFYTTVTLIGAAIFRRGHSHHLVALHVSAERTSHTTISTGGFDAVIRLTVIDNALFHQCCSRAGLYAGTAGNTFGVDELFADAC